MERCGSVLKESPVAVYNHRTFFAEDEGFKPPIPERGIPDFESSAFGHSANLPCMLSKDSAKVIFILNKCNYSKDNLFNFSLSIPASDFFIPRLMVHVLSNV